MALEVKANWDVEMSKPAVSVTSSRLLDLAKKEADTTEPSSVDSIMQTNPSRQLALPLELVIQILEYLPQGHGTQPTLWACSLVSRAWYKASAARLYQSPYLYGGNFDAFVRTTCPSKNAHITHSALASLVQSLDMGKLVHEPTRSLTARLLGRLKKDLVCFVAPQASFAINCFAALSKCSKLRYLDLSLLSATVSSELLFKTVRSLSNLETLILPRCSATSFPDMEKHCIWPPRLRTLHLAGLLGGNIISCQTNPPNSLVTLKIQNISNIRIWELKGILQKYVPQLKSLTLQYPIGDVTPVFCDDNFSMCPNILSLAVSADYFSPAMWDNIPQSHPLRTLEMDVSPMAKFENFVSPSDIYIAVEEGRLPDLRSIKFSKRFNWVGGTHRQLKDSMSLVELLEANEQERPLGIQTGLWPMDG